MDVTKCLLRFQVVWNCWVLVTPDYGLPLNRNNTSWWTTPVDETTPVDVTYILTKQSPVDFQQFQQFRKWNSPQPKGEPPGAPAAMRVHCVPLPAPGPPSTKTTEGPNRTSVVLPGMCNKEEVLRHRNVHMSIRTYVHTYIRTYLHKYISIYNHIKLDGTLYGPDIQRLPMAGSFRWNFGADIKILTVHIWYDMNRHHAAEKSRFLAYFWVWISIWSSPWVTAKL